ncbi:hypothetical protein BDV11DRAFT_19608 [Aspergillus similis]
MFFLDFALIWRLVNRSNVLLRFLLLLCLAFAAESPSLRMIFSRVWQPRNIVEQNLLLSAFLTHLVLRRKRLGLPYYLWLLFMTFEANYLAVRCQDPQTYGLYRWVFFLLTVGQVCIILLIALRIEDSDCLICQRKRFSLATVAREGRKTRPIYFVSTPAFGPPWLPGQIKRFQDQVTALYGRLSIYFHSTKLSDENKHSWMSDARLIAMSKVSLTHLTLLLLNLIGFIWQLLGPPSSPLNTLIRGISVLILTLLAGFSSKGFIWNAWDLICHHALEIDGVTYELKRTGWFKDSIELLETHVKRTDEEASRKEILSRTLEGGTFFTHDEILRCAKELIEVSPNYDIFTYNCQAFRYNLFRRIMDDQYKTRVNAIDRARLFRLDWHYVHPNHSVTAVLVQLAMFSNGLDPFSDCKTFFGLLRCVLGIIHLDHTLKGIMYGTSTAYGWRFCVRRAGLLVLSITLVLRAAFQSLDFGMMDGSLLGKVLVALMAVQGALVTVALPFQASQGHANSHSAWSDMSVSSFELGGNKPVIS